MKLIAIKDAPWSPSLLCLAPRERQIFLGIACGEMPQQMADRLELSVKTIATYRARALDKLKLDSNQQCTALAIHHGLIDLVVDPVVIQDSKRAA